MPQTVGLLCHVFALACPPGPDAAAIQAAYEREAAAGSTRHDPGLQVLSARCHDDREDRENRFLCEVTFLSRNDPTQQLYFDVVAVQRLDGGWALKSGLCRR